MENDILSAIKNTRTGAQIHSNDEYVVFITEKVYILNRLSGRVLCRDDITNADKAVFLSGNRLLLTEGRKAYFRLISLESGLDIWNTPPIPFTNTGRKLLVDANEEFAYDLAYKLLGKKTDGDYLQKVNIRSGTREEILVKNELRVSRAIEIDEAGNIFVLQSQNDETFGRRQSQIAVVCHQLDPETKRVSYSVPYRFRRDIMIPGKFFLNGEECVLTEDLYVINLKTGEEYFLLENDPTWVYPDKTLYGCWVDKSGKYIFLKYQEANVVIDWAERRMIARYADFFSKGCLIDNEYWIISSGGVRREPFPKIEDIPPPQTLESVLKAFAEELKKAREAT